MSEYWALNLWGPVRQNSLNSAMSDQPLARLLACMAENVRMDTYIHTEAVDGVRFTLILVVSARFRGLPASASRIYAANP